MVFKLEIAFVAIVPPHPAGEFARHEVRLHFRKILEIVVFEVLADQVISETRSRVRRINIAISAPKNYSGDSEIAFHFRFPCDDLPPQPSSRVLAEVDR